MRWKEIKHENCSVARALSVIGDRWTLMILRDCFMRVRRFEDFQKSLGLARRVLTERLAKLVEDGILKKVPYQENPVRFEYRLTEKGLDLYPIMITLVHWGDKHYADENGPPILHRHRTCGHDFRSVVACSECSESINPREVDIRSNESVGPTRTNQTARG